MLTLWPEHVFVWTLDSVLGVAVLGFFILAGLVMALRSIWAKLKEWLGWY